MYIDYAIENKHCIACIDSNKRLFEFPCNECNDKKKWFNEDSRENIINNVTNKNGGY